MAIVSKPGFPVREGDQAEVIRIFIELMRERDRAERAPQAATTWKPFAARNDSRNAEIPRELLDFE